jgi:non-specific serine/threonine protein kinase
MSGTGAADPPLYLWRFSGIEYDEARMELRADGGAVAMEPRPLQVLALLLRHAGEVVTKQELFDAVWAGRPTVDHVLATAVGKLRRAFGDEREELIATVPRLGYRFVGAVERIVVGRRMTSGLSFERGQSVPGREHFRLEAQLDRTLASEVWLARHDKTREARVYKFGFDATHLSALKREATLARVLRESLGERDDFVRVIDWNFATEPFYLEEEYGGKDLLAWAADAPDLAHWTLSERVAFFLPIADALAAAHGVGVLHKDLKPANVLVQPGGDGWRARIADFGSGRLLEPERLEELGITALGLTRTNAISPDSSGGTLLYLAPEVIAGHMPTAQSDIYALGILLYQVAVGDLRKPLTSGWERDIDDALLREDIARATDGEPSRRLASAAELADRLRRLPERRAEREHLAATERSEQIARRALERSRARRPWVAALVGALALGLGIAAWLYGRADAARVRAEHETARSTAIRTFLSDDLLGAADPSNAYYDGDPTIAELLRRAEATLAGRFAHEPDIRGAVYEALARAYAGFGRTDAATDDYDRAAAAYDAAGSTDAALRVRYDAIRMLALRHSYEGADRRLSETTRLAGDRAGNDPELALHAALARGMLANQRFDAHGTLREYTIADALQRAHWPDDASLAIAIRSRLADGHLRLGEFAEAEDVIRHRMLDDPILSEQRVGKAAIGSMHRELARVLRNQSHLDEARVEAESAVAMMKAGLGPDHFHVIDALSVLSSIYQDLHQCDAALATAREVVQRYTAVRPMTDQGTLIEVGNLGFVEYDCGDLPNAIVHLTQAEQGLVDHYGDGLAAVQVYRVGIAKALADTGRYDDALAKLGNVSGAAMQSAETRSGALDEADFTRGRIYVLQGRRDEGLDLLRALKSRIERRKGGSDILAEIDEFLERHEAPR